MDVAALPSPVSALPSPSFVAVDRRRRRDASRLFSNGRATAAAAKAVVSGGLDACRFSPRARAME